MSNENVKKAKDFLMFLSKNPDVTEKLRAQKLEEFKNTLKNVGHSDKADDIKDLTMDHFKEAGEELKKEHEGVELIDHYVTAP